MAVFIDGQAPTFFLRKNQKSESLRQAVLCCSFWLAFISPLTNAVGADSQQTAAEIRALTGARARIVWVQDQDDNRDFGASSNRFKLMGLDTDDERGEREILPTAVNLSKPLITSNGRRVVFSNFKARTVYVVNWDGTGLRRLVNGFAVDVWSDPRTGIEWVYVQAGKKDGEAFRKNPILRYQIDKPEVEELVWDRTAVDARVSGNFQLSADGTRAGGLYPWSESGIAELPNGPWRKYGFGCWTSLAPDNSYRFWKFDGQHRNLILFDPGSDTGKTVPINTAPGTDGYEVYHPRWSNHPLFLTMTGPYKVGGGGNRIGGGGEAVEIHLGKFDSAFTKIARWAQVTHNNRADFFPDAWIDPGATRSATGIAGSAPHVATNVFRAPASWPGDADALVFLWENSSKMNEIADPIKRTSRSCRLEARGLARYGRYQVMETERGAFVAEGGNAELLSACKHSQQLTIEALITPAKDAPPGAAKIISFSSGAIARDFSLDQQGDRLVLRLRTSTTGDSGADLELCKIAPAKSQHIIVAYSPGKLTCYRDGEAVLVSEKVKGNLSNWTPQHLLFGDEWDGGHNWAGALEGVAIYSRTVGVAEAQRKFQNYTARLKGRKPAEQLVARVRLKDITQTPTPESIAPYRRALVVHGYAVEKVVSGQYARNKILVAHWAIMDAKVLAHPGWKLDAVSQMAVEKFEDHPELEGERVVRDDSDFELPLYYDPKP